MIRKIVAAAILLSAGLSGCTKAAAPTKDVAARVNGRVISRSDVEKYFNFKTQDAPQRPTGDAAMLAKFDILRDLIEREIMAQKAEQLKLKAKDAEMDAQIQQLRGPLTPEEFRKNVQQRGFSEDYLRNEIRRTLAGQMVIQDQVISKIQVSDAEVSQFYNENKETFNIRETQYHLGQIVVTPNPSVPVTNLRNDKALNMDQAVSKAERLRTLLRQGNDFQQVAREYSEDPQTARQGGDVGYQPASALDRLAPALKQSIVKMNVGDITPVMQTPDAFWILKLLGKREPGQKSLQDPEVNASIRAEIRNRKQQLLVSALAEQLHNAAKIENFMAQEILAASPKSK